MRTRAGWAAGVLAVLCTLAAACGDEAGPPSPYPGDGPYVAGQGDLARPWPGVAELLSDADLIAVVEPTGERSEVWNPTETFVSSRFAATVVQVLSGAVQAGDSILLYAPGGAVRDPFPATGSRRPVPGESTTVVEYVDWPWFKTGVRELVFLKYQAPGAGDEPYTPFYWTWGPSARYSIDGEGRLQAIYPGGTDVEDPGGVREQLAGLTLDELQARIEAATR